MSTYSFTLAGVDVRVRRFPVTRWTRNIEWIPLADGTFAGLDRGAGGDIHESDVVIFGTRDQVEAVQAAIDADRGVQAITNINCQLFDSLIDHGQAITVLVATGSTDQREYVQDEGGFYEFQVTLRAVTYSKVSTIGSFSSLRTGSKAAAGHGDPVRPRWSYGNVPSPSTGSDAEAAYTREFYQDNLETQAILRKVDAVRGDAFPFPALDGVNYPFGASRGNTDLYCNARVVETRRANLHFCLTRISFSQAFR